MPLCVHCARYGLGWVRNGWMPTGMACCACDQETKEKSTLCFVHFSFITIIFIFISASASARPFHRIYSFLLISVLHSCRRRKANEIICIILINCNQNRFHPFHCLTIVRQNGTKPSGKRHSRAQMPFLCARMCVCVLWYGWMSWCRGILHS